jgi:predicted hydrocarbon binding protein
MLYVPRHFFVNTHIAIEPALGVEKYAPLVYEAGYASAHFWCASESRTHGLAPLATYEHYLTRLSQRGWGRFAFTAVDAERGTAQIRLEHSAFVLARPGVQGRLCYLFAGWFAGAMDWVLEQAPTALRTLSHEATCAAEGHSHCVFSVRPLEP